MNECSYSLQNPFQNPLIQLYLIKLWKAFVVECKVSAQNDIQLLYCTIDGSLYDGVFINRILPAFRNPFGLYHRSRVTYYNFANDLFTVFNQYMYDESESINRLNDLLCNTTYIVDGVRHFRNSVDIRNHYAYFQADKEEKQKNTTGIHHIDIGITTKQLPKRVHMHDFSQNLKINIHKSQELPIIHRYNFQTLETKESSFSLRRKPYHAPALNFKALAHKMRNRKLTSSFFYSKSIL